MDKFFKNVLIIVIVLIIIIGLYLLIRPKMLEYLKRKKEEGDVKEKLSSPLYDFFKAPNEIPPNLKKLLEKVGDFKIKNIKICRSPITKAIRFLTQFVKDREFVERYQTLGYDDIFHLYMLLEVEDNEGQAQFYKLEKNVIVTLDRIKRPYFYVGYCFEIKIETPITISQLLEMAQINLKTNRPCAKFWVYHPINNNCQHFIINLLEGVGLLTDDLEHFIDQDVPGLIDKFPILKCFSDLGKKFTDITSCLCHFSQNLR